MEISRGQIERITTIIEEKIGSHPVLRVVNDGGSIGDGSVEQNLIDCFDRLKRLVDDMDKHVCFYADVTLQYGCFSLSVH